MRILCALMCALFIPQGGWVRWNQQPPPPAPRRASSSQALTPSVEAQLVNARRAFADQNYRAAETYYLQALSAPQAASDRLALARAKWGLGATYLATGDYGRTLTNLLEARSAYESFGDRSAVAAINGNLSSLYAQLGELEAALDVGERSVRDLPKSDTPRYAAPLYLNLGIVQAKLGRWNESVESFTEGIEAARRTGDREAEATGWDKLGMELLQAGHTARAEHPLVEAFRLRRLFLSPKLSVSRENLSLLKLEQGDFATAASLLGPPPPRVGPGGAGWSYYYVRGRLRQLNGRMDAAIADYREAADRLDRRRRSLPSADALRIGADWVWQRVPTALVSAAAQQGARRHDRKLIEEAFVTLEQHRAKSLLERMGAQRFRPSLETAWSARLGAAEEALATSAGSLPQFRQARSEWLEADHDRFPARAEHWLWPELQQALGRNTVLLSFHLDETTSRLWMATDEGLRMASLPPRRRLAALIRAFRSGVESGGEAAEPGSRLCEALFGQLPPGVHGRSEWLLSLDEDLFDLPFAALPCGPAGGYLAEQHTLRIVPGAGVLFVPKPRWSPYGVFAGLGDPVYNLADPRGRQATLAGPVPPQLNRLPGTAKELDVCLGAWRGPSVVLTGSEVTRSGLRHLLNADPAVLHLATHVVKPAAGVPVDALIALSLSPQGEPQFLGQTEISAAWRTSAALVVLSGCASGDATARRGVGLEGMTRAWLAAGAASVVASYWPTPDNSAAFFGEFYAALQAGDSEGAAGALRSAQRRMIAAGDWRSDPRYWASYFVIGRW